MSGQKTASAQLTFWLKWILATFAASVVTCAAGFEVYYAYVGFRFLEFIALLYGSSGAVIGIAQWLVLRRELPRAGWWIVVNAIGYGIGAPLGYLVGFIVDVLFHGLLPTGVFLFIASVIASGFLAIIVIVSVQWIWWRQLRHIPWCPVGGILWVVASVAGVLISRPAYEAVVHDLGVGVVGVAGAAFGAVFGITYGAITGCAAAGLWRRSAQGEAPT